MLCKNPLTAKEAGERGYIPGGQIGLNPASLCLHIPTSQVSSAQFIFPRPNVPRRGHFLLRSARQGLWAEPVEPLRFGNHR